MFHVLFKLQSFLQVVTHLNAVAYGSSVRRIDKKMDVLVYEDFPKICQP